MQTCWHSSRRAEGAIPGRQLFESNAPFQGSDLRPLTKEKSKAQFWRRCFSQTGLLRLFLELSQVPMSLLPHASRRSPTQPHRHLNTWEPHWQASPPFEKGHHGDNDPPNATAALSCAADGSSALGWGWARVTRAFTGRLHFLQAGYGKDLPALSPPRASQLSQAGRGGRFVPPPGHHVTSNTWD